MQFNKNILCIKKKILQKQHISLPVENYEIKKTQIIRIKYMRILHKEFSRNIENSTELVYNIDKIRPIKVCWLQTNYI